MISENGPSIININKISYITSISYFCKIIFNYRTTSFKFWIGHISIFKKIIDLIIYSRKGILVWKQIFVSPQDTPEVVLKISRLWKYNRLLIISLLKSPLIVVSNIPNHSAACIAGVVNWWPAGLFYLARATFFKVHRTILKFMVYILLSI